MSLPDDVLLERLSTLHQYAGAADGGACGGGRSGQIRHNFCKVLQIVNLSSICTKGTDFPEFLGRRRFWRALASSPASLCAHTCASFGNVT